MLTKSKIAMKNLTLSIIALLFCFSAWAQTEKKPTQLSESIYILPKAGMNEQFEAAVAAHNKKFHPEGEHYAVLRRVEYGAKAGWYVWIMKGTYASLDSRPDKEGGHADDWTTTVDPTVEKYGETGLWGYNEKLSFGMDILKKQTKYTIWAVTLKPGQWERFSAFAEKIRATYESMGDRAFLVYMNQIHTAGGADVAFVWSFDKYADLDEDSGTKEAYEKLYGEGSWKLMIEEWLDISVDYNEEIRTML